MCRLWAYLSVSIDDIFRCGQSQKSHRSPRMKLLCADTDLCPETEFKSICKTCGGIDINCRSIHLIEESLCIKIIMGHNALGMSGVVVIDMCDGSVSRIDNLAGDELFLNPLHTIMIDF